MSEAKKKLKKRMKICDSHRAFVRKAIAEAKESRNGGGPVDPKRLKSIKSTLKDKLQELKGLDEQVLEYLDEAKLEEDVNDSCDFISAIQTCIVDLETALNSVEDHGKYQEVASSVSQSVRATQPSVSQFTAEPNCRNSN